MNAEERASAEKLKVLLANLATVMQNNESMVKIVNDHYRGAIKPPTSQQALTANIINNIGSRGKVSFKVDKSRVGQKIEEVYGQLKHKYKFPQPTYVVEEGLSYFFELLDKKSIDIEITDVALGDTIKNLQSQGRLKNERQVILAYLREKYSRNSWKAYPINRLTSNEITTVDVRYQITGSIQNLTKLTKEGDQEKPQYKPQGANDPMSEFAKIAETKEVKSWLSGSYNRALDEISLMPEIYEKKRAIYMYVGITLTVEYVAQSLPGMNKQTGLDETDEELMKALNRESFTRSLLQGLLYSLWRALPVDRAKATADGFAVMLRLDKPLQNGRLGYYSQEYDDDEERQETNQLQKVDFQKIKNIVKGYPELTTRESDGKNISLFTVSLCLAALGENPQIQDLREETDRRIPRA